MNTDIKPKIAVLLAAYNGMQWIEEQVNSIFEQTDVDVTLFISVDQSTDETYLWCKRQAEFNPKLFVIPYGERFGGAAKNFFRLIRDVDFSSFDYVSLADQDDIWLPNKLSHAVITIDQRSLDAFSSDVLAFWQDGKERLVKKSFPQKRYDHFFEAAGPGCTYVFATRALEQFKQFLTSNWNEVNAVELHDWMIYAFFRQRGLKWYIDDCPLMRYRQHAGNQVGFNSGVKAYIKRIVMVKEHWYRHEVEKISTLLGFKKPTRWFCIRNFWQLRRRPRDAFALLIMNIIGIF